MDYSMLFQFGFVGVVAFGLVASISLLLKKKWNYVLPADYKLYLLIGFAFALSFVPVDLGNLIFNRLKDAVTVAMAIASLNTFANKVGGN